MLTNPRRGLIAMIMYGIQFRKDLMSIVDTVRDSFLMKRGIDVIPEATLDALAALRHSDVDVSTLLPQPHSDAELREFFVALERSLRAATAKPD
jgi:hypothetical protein